MGIERYLTGKRVENIEPLYPVRGHLPGIQPFAETMKSLRAQGIVTNIEFERAVGIVHEHELKEDPTIAELKVLA